MFWKKEEDKKIIQALKNEIDNLKRQISEIQIDSRDRSRKFEQEFLKVGGALTNLKKLIGDNELKLLELTKKLDSFSNEWITIPELANRLLISNRVIQGQIKSSKYQGCFKKDGNLWRVNYRMYEKIVNEK